MNDHVTRPTSHVFPRSAGQATQPGGLPRWAPSLGTVVWHRGASWLLALAALLLANAGAEAQSVWASQNISTSLTQLVAVTAPSSLSGSQTVSRVEVLSNGVTSENGGTEFVKATGPSTVTCVGTALSASGSCTQSVTFTPAYPGVRIGAVELFDGNGTLLATQYLSGIGQGGLDVLTPGNILDIAGKYQVVGSASENPIPATAAGLNQPAGVAVDGAGNVYIADYFNNQVRMVCSGTNSATIHEVGCGNGKGYLVPVAGRQGPGYSGDGGLAASSTLRYPSSLALDGAGNLYIADSGNNVIRKIDAVTGFISTVAGNYGQGSGYTGDGGPATDAQLNSPSGITVDTAGNIYIADTDNQAIRRVDATGKINTIVGTGPNVIDASLNRPFAVAFDADGNMYIPDSRNGLIRKVTATNHIISTGSSIATVVGGSGGTQTGCSNSNNGTAISDIELVLPEGVAIDAASNIYIADTGNKCIRKANVKTGNAWALATENNNAITLENVESTVQIVEPIQVTLDGSGNLYFADFLSMTVDEIQSNVAVLNFPVPVLEGSQSSSSQIVTIENDGNASSALASVKPDANAALDPKTTTCGPGDSLIQDADCNVGAFFAPSVVGDPLLGHVYVAGNTINDETTPLDIVLVGDGTEFIIGLTVAPPSPQAYGTRVSFTATVTEKSGTPTGSVTFTDSLNGGAAKPLGTATLIGGQAVFSTNTLAVGNHTITATYSANASTASVSYTIFEGTTTQLSASPKSPSGLGASVTFTATVTTTATGGPALDGTVTFTDSDAPTAFDTNVVHLKNDGTAQYTTAALVQGLNHITAAYSPANTTLIKDSTGALIQDVVAPSTMTLASNPTSSTYGNPVAFTVALPNSGTTPAGGTVSIAIVPVGANSPIYPLTVNLGGNPATGTASISSLPVGTYNATATYGGDQNYGSATATLAPPLVVNQVQTTTNAAASPSPAFAGRPVAITATVKAATGTETPAGTVTCTDTFNGTTVPLGVGTVTLDSKGTAIVTPSLAAGTHSILVAYSGDANDGKSSFTLSLVVNQAATFTVVTASPSPAIVEGTITFTATVTANPAGAPTGAVSFFANGTIALGAANLDATGKASVTSATLAAGSYQITAVYGGDAENLGSTSAAITEVVGLIPTATTLSTASTKGPNAQTILVSTVEDDGASGPLPTGTVTFKTGTTTVGSASLNTDGVATLTPNLLPGTYSMIAYYAGDSLHGPSQSKPVSINGQGSSFTLAITPPSVTVATTQNTNVTVTLTSISGFADTIGLGCASLPAGVNCHFSSISIPLASGGTATAQLTIDTNNPLGGGATAMNKAPEVRTVAMAGLFLPLSFFLGWMLWRFRRSHAGAWSIVLTLALSGAALLATGCSGFTQNTAAPGTYTFQVVGVGVNSNVSQYQDVTITITK